MKIDAIWNSARNILFEPETDLFYDYVTSHNRAERFSHLPNADEAKADFPNPCGWGTGMEDCMLNAGSVLDILWKLFPDPDFTAAVVRGIANCCEAHRRPGFVARGLTPGTEHCCYSNTSRDQLTLAVYGLWRVVHSHSDVSPELRAEITRLLKLIAEDCRRHVVSVNQFNLCRLDGRPGLVCNMCHCADHEALRLPMVYLAAFEASRESKYLDWAREYLPSAVKQTLSLEQQHLWWHLPLVQMQLSILLVMECGAVPEYKETLKYASDQLSHFAMKQFLPALTDAENFRGAWDVPNANWRLLPMRVQNATISADRKNALFEGKGYLNPIYPESYSVPKELFHRLGSYLTVMFASGRGELPREWATRLERLLSQMDFSRCCHDGPIKLLHAFCFLTEESSTQGVRHHETSVFAE